MSPIAGAILDRPPLLGVLGPDRPVSPLCIADYLENGVLSYRPGSGQPSARNCPRDPTKCTASIFMMQDRD
jgi:hypothetical protein